METQTQQQPRKRPHIWAIGGGKGGVGKSVVSILLALGLAHNNQKTVLVDADLGAANLHTLMGIKTPARNLNDLITQKYDRIEDICVQTQVNNLRLVCGASEILYYANPQFSQKHRIVQSIAQLAADHVILDLGAGTSYNVLDFFLIADRPVIVLTPQPISIQNAYAFIRNAVYRKLSRMAHQHPSLQEVIRLAMNPKNDDQIRTIADLHEKVLNTHGAKAADRMLEAIRRIRPILITNMAKEQRDGNAGRIIQVVAEKYLTIQCQGLGAIAYDPLIEKLITQMLPISALPKSSRPLANAAAIVQKLIG
ncbi:MAG: P-loop NTPase [Desulfatitalea sp.]